VSARVGEVVDYVSPFRTGEYEGVVTAVNADGTVALDVYLPGAATVRGREAALSLRAVSYGPVGRARSKSGGAKGVRQNPQR
jgi:hypothetical protein